MVEEPSKPKNTPDPDDVWAEDPRRPEEEKPRSKFSVILTLILLVIGACFALLTYAVYVCADGCRA